MATDIPVSRWFVLVACFGALFLVAGKRWAELCGAGATRRARPALSGYSSTFLVAVIAAAGLGATIAYWMWAFRRPRTGRTSSRISPTYT